MAALITITSTQCKRARALLKWNPQDLASRTRIPVRHIEKFERNQVKLLKPENAEIIEAFAKKNVTFRSNGDVELSHGSSSHETQGDYERTNADEMLADKPQQPPLTAAEARTLATSKAPTEKKVNLGTSPQTSDD